MRINMTKKVFETRMFRAILICVPLVANICAAQEVDPVLVEGKNKTVAAQKSQKRIDKLAAQTYDIMQDFKVVNKQLEGIKVYNAQLGKYIQNQKQTMLDIEYSIKNTTVIERQIVPLSLKMLDALEQFINLDLPFQRETRLTSIAQVRENLGVSRFSTSEKFRQVLELYDIESEYGNTIDQYSGLLEVEGLEQKVTFLRVGRIALLYQTSNQAKTGAWSKQEKQWQALDSGEYRSATAKAIRIAKKQAAVDVLNLPIAFPEAVK